jgi:formylglycine-generating enzyme required for sulfatase activity
MTWPLSQDYNEAVQNPALRFSDAELKQTEARGNAIGIPMARSGNFADVYEMTGPGGKKWAVKCFTREVPDLRERYAAISAYLKQANLPFMVDFSYLEQGIKVKGQWYPVLKMDWVEGLGLNEFVKQQADNPPVLDLLAQIWLRLAQRLREAKMAHCDLQHGNVLLVPGSQARSLAVRLIDYDGMFVPALAQTKSGEVGHPAYQHPQRLREGTYNAEVDRFPHLVIYTALRSLMVGGRYLWNKYDNGDNLLFRQADLDDPGKSALFAELLKLDDAELRKLVQGLAQSTQKPLEQTPLLDELAGATAKRKSAVTVSPAGPTPAAAFAQAAADHRTRRPRRSAQRSVVGVAVVGVVALAALGIGAVLAKRNGKPTDTEPVVAAAYPAPSTLRRVEPTQPEMPKQPESKKDAEPRKELEPKTGPEPAPLPKPEPAPKPEPTLPEVAPTAPRPAAGEVITNSIGMKLTQVRAGTFRMGGGGGKHGTRRVTIPRDFYLGVYPVTQQQWQAIMGKDPSYFSRTGAGRLLVRDMLDVDLEYFPVEQVSWHDARQFIRKLNEREKHPGWVYRLPSEAEWEYACRGAATSSEEGAFDFYLDPPSNALSSLQANFDGNRPAGGAAKGPNLQRTTRVGSYPPNRIGLYDMHGNVWQWCDDGSTSGSERVRRGGSWRADANLCRAAFRSKALATGRYSDVGFRLARVPSTGKEPDVRQFTNLIGMRLALLPAAKFVMGSPDNEPRRSPHEGPQHEVALSRPFYIGVHKVTVGQLRAFVQATGYRTEAEISGGAVVRGPDGKFAGDPLATWRNPKFEQTDEHPVVCVSWNDAQEFCGWLSKKEGKRYRLPTEAQWEYGCRAGSSTRFPFGDRETDLPEYAWFNLNSGMRTHPVGQKKPNAWGLYDMLGNAREWTADWYDPDYYRQSARQDPPGPSDGRTRVLRGAGFHGGGADCRSAYRDSRSPSHRSDNFGFRVVMEQ